MIQKAQTTKRHKFKITQTLNPNCRVTVSQDVGCPALMLFMCMT